MQRIHVIDSHTGGEPTRLVMSGGPDLGSGPMAERLERFRREHDDFRSAVVNEPRGSGVIVGALLCEPSDRSCAAGVIFFNNVGYLGMCGHGTIGLIASLSYLNRIQPGAHRIETPVGVVEATLHPPPTPPWQGGEYANRITVRNVPGYRHAAGVTVHVDGIGSVTGDVAWGGNWFFLINDHGQIIQASNIQTLTAYATYVKDALVPNGITGADGAEIDHIELFAPSDKPGVNSKNFVLCPGNAYDRSPCGTGTSAKMACLFSDGKLHEGEVWRQESVIGSVFEGTIELDDAGRIIPSITGEAFVTAKAELILDPRDPLRFGIRSA